MRPHAGPGRVDPPAAWAASPPSPQRAALPWMQPPPSVLEAGKPGSPVATAVPPPPRELQRARSPEVPATRVNPRPCGAGPGVPCGWKSLGPKEVVFGISTSVSQSQERGDPGRKAHLGHPWRSEPLPYGAQAEGAPSRGVPASQPFFHVYQMTCPFPVWLSPGINVFLVCMKPFALWAKKIFGIGKICGSKVL